jgi:hypothetical protein
MIRPEAGSRLSFAGTTAILKPMGKASPRLSAQAGSLVRFDSNLRA